MLEVLVYLLLQLGLAGSTTTQQTTINTTTTTTTTSGELQQQTTTTKLGVSLLLLLLTVLVAQDGMIKTNFLRKNRIKLFYILTGDLLIFLLNCAND
jgi:hypothetical protein